MRKRALLLFVVVVALAVCAGRAADGIARIRLAGSINPASMGFVLRAIEQAEKDGVALFLIELNTPGGLGESMRDIVIAELG